MANLTVTIDDDLLQKARERAVTEKTSVNAIVREYLTKYVEDQESARRERAVRAVAALEEIARNSKARIGDYVWNRDELYDRHSDK